MQLKENRQIKQMYSSKFLLSNIMQIYWGVTNNCNLKCHYCSKYKSEEFYNLDYVNGIVEFINNLSNIKSAVFLKLFGGEPTTHPNILDIIKNINSKVNVELQTNLILDSLLLNEIIKIKNINAFNISLHYGLVDRNIFFKNLNLLLKHSSKYKYNILLNLMYEKDYHKLIDKDYQIYNQLSKAKAFYNFNVGISLVYHNINGEYDEATVDWVNNTYKKFKQSDRHINIIYNDDTMEQSSFYYIKGMGYNKCKGMKCSCLKNNIYIDSNGDIYPCQSYFRDLKRKYGNILQDNNILDKLINEEYIICEADTCDCELDISKWR